MPVYQEFAKEALSSYKEMPEETNELYKKYFVKIPELEEGPSLPSLQEDLAKRISSEYEKMGIRFGAIFGSGASYISDDIIQAKGIDEFGEELIRNKLYKNGEDKYASYIHAFSSNFAIISVPPHKAAEATVLIFNSEAATNMQVLADVGEGARLKLIEVCASSKEAKTHLGIMNEVRAMDSSNAEIAIIHNESKSTIVLNYLKALAWENASIKVSSLYSGGLITRARTVLEAHKANSSVELSEILIGIGMQKFDVGASIINAAEQTNAYMESKAVLFDEARAIMKGFAKLNKGAKKSRSSIVERGLMFDRTAKATSMPEMSIDENDVKADHSSATAPLDPESLFYMASKGIDNEKARKMLAFGFFSSTISRIKDVRLRKIISAMAKYKIDVRKIGDIPAPQYFENLDSEIDEL